MPSLSLSNGCQANLVWYHLLMLDYKYDKSNPGAILKHAEQMIGKSLRDVLDEVSIDEIIELRADKGRLGALVEKYVFDIRPGNTPGPDFPEAGVELKTTGIKPHTSNGFVAKERLAFGMINFHDVVHETWEESSFLKKNALVMLMVYLFTKDTSSLDLEFKLVKMLDIVGGLPEKDLRIIKQDWHYIVEKIREGKAHELSESDTFYLGACTKGRDSKDLTSQPMSTVQAMRRAFSLRQGYLNSFIAQGFVSAQDDSESILGETATESIEEVISERFEPFLGMTTDEIHGSLALSSNKKAKSYFADLARRMLGVNKEFVEEFKKAEISMKTIRLKASGTPKEHMAFPAMDYEAIIGETWETSSFRDLLSQKKYLFVVYQFDQRGELRFQGAKFWNVPFSDLETYIRPVWNETVARIKNGRADDLPKTADYPVCHVRPHARDRDDTRKTHYGADVVKQSFWLHAKYIGEQVRDLAD